MRTLNRYLTGSFLVTFLLALLIVTFVMCIGIMFKVTDLIARGVSWQPVLRVLVDRFPQALTYSIPISVLVTCLLMFGRLSADGEIVAMRASGVNIWNIVQRPCLLAAILGLVCAVINNEVVPKGHLASRVELSKLGMQTPLELLEEGRFIQDFPGMTLYITKRKDNTLQGVRIYDLRKPGIRREIRATTGIVREAQGGGVSLDLRDVRIDPFADDRPGAAYCEQWLVNVPRDTSKGVYIPNKNDETFFGLLDDIRTVSVKYPHFSAEDALRYRTLLTVELHKRFSLAASCFAFAVLGIPLGIKAHRKESSVGIGISLLLVFHYYVFIMIAESFEKNASAQPHLITWIPILISLAVGAWLINRHN